MDLGQNFLTGPLPNFNATELGRLDLSLNQLRGTIPSGIGTLALLRYVDLTENFLYGTVPDMLGMDEEDINCDDGERIGVDECGMFFESREALEKMIFPG